MVFGDDTKSIRTWDWIWKTVDGKGKLQPAYDKSSSGRDYKIERYWILGAGKDRKCQERVLLLL